MRIFVRNQAPELKSGLLALLLATFDAERSEVWLLSPWLRDVELPVAGQGAFASLFGGQRERVSLSEVLGSLATRHRLHIVIKPPHELVPLEDVKRLFELFRAMQELRDDEGLSAYESVSTALHTLSEEAGALADLVTMHTETLRIGRELHTRGAELLFLPKLHAKLLWTPVGALLGSANFTNGGFGGNEELMVEVTNAEDHGQLKETAELLGSRSVAVEKYRLGEALQRADVTDSEFNGWPDQLTAADQGRLRELLVSLALMV